MDFEKDPQQPRQYIFSVDDPEEWMRLARLSWPPITLGRFILNNKLIEREPGSDFPQTVNLSGFEAVRIARLISRPLQSATGRMELALGQNNITRDMVLTATNFLSRKKSGTI